MLDGTEMTVSTRAWVGKTKEKKIYGSIMGMGMHGLEEMGRSLNKNTADEQYTSSMH